jgi:repressor LexA
MLDPTPRQAEVLTYIRQYRRDHDISPTLAEIGRALGISTPMAFKHVAALERAGAVRRVPRVPRSVCLVD